VGLELGIAEGSLDGSELGLELGIAEGSLLGIADGSELGPVLGIILALGCGLGSVLGITLTLGCGLGQELGSMLAAGGGVGQCFPHLPSVPSQGAGGGHACVGCGVGVVNLLEALISGVDSVSLLGASVGCWVVSGALGSGLVLDGRN